jgi:hypothetical protein
MNTTDFTMADAMKIQADHLAFYERALKPEVFSMLKDKVEAINANGYTNPYHVCRGTNIDNLFFNLFNDLRN